MKRFSLVLLVLIVSGWVAYQTPPRLRGTIDLTIGGEDGAPEYTFGFISGLALGPDGRIYVADSQDQLIRAYSPAGKYLFAIGAKGSGPGEFTGLASIAFAPDGALWARDEGNARYSSFIIGETSARYRSTIRTLNQTRQGRRPIVFTSDGNVIEIGGVTAIDASPYRIVRTTLAADSRVVAADTTMEPPADSIGVRLVRSRPDAATQVVRYFYEPFAALAITAHGPNGEMARAVTSRYAVSWSTLAGRRIRLLQRDITGPEATPAERKAQQERQDGQLAWARTQSVSVPTHRVPDRKQPLEALQFSQDGDLWVERTPAAGKPREADIYDRTGRFVAIAEWSGFSLLHFQSAIVGRTAITVTRDSLEVERVVRVRFR